MFRRILQLLLKHCSSFDDHLSIEFHYVVKTIRHFQNSEAQGVYKMSVLAECFIIHFHMNHSWNGHCWNVSMVLCRYHSALHLMWYNINVHSGIFWKWLWFTFSFAWKLFFSVFLSYPVMLWMCTQLPCFQ